MMETERLLLRELQLTDFDDLAQLLQDPQVMYAYEHPFTSEDVQVWLDRQRTRYKENGFGLWALVLKSTGEMIGQAGLTLQPYHEQKILEIGYLLKKAFWHQGYAQEATEACKHYAFEILNQDKVYSIIKADNEASMKVAKAIGMEKVDEFITEYYNSKQLHYLFMMNKPKK